VSALWQSTGTGFPVTAFTNIGGLRWTVSIPYYSFGAQCLQVCDFSKYFLDFSHLMNWNYPFFANKQVWQVFGSDAFN